MRKNKSLYKHLNVDYKPEIFQKNLHLFWFILWICTMLFFFFFLICTTVYLKMIFEFWVIVSEILNIFMHELGWTLLWASIEEFVSSLTKPNHVSSRFCFHYTSLTFLFLLVDLLSNKCCLLSHVTGIILTSPRPARYAWLLLLFFLREVSLLSLFCNLN